MFKNKYFEGNELEYGFPEHEFQTRNTLIITIRIRVISDKNSCLKINILQELN